MDGGGPHGLPGALLDPMTMTDAELLDSVPANGDQMNTDLMKISMGGDENHTGSSNENENKMKNEISDPKAKVTKLEKQKHELEEKNDLNEDELTDLREQFGSMD